MDVDDVFEKIGEFGTTQKKILLPMNTLVHTLVSFHMLMITFIGLDPDWSCADSLESSTTRHRSLLGSADPKFCELYNSGHCELQFGDGFRSIAASWKLICDRASYPFLSQSLYFVGFLLGSWLWGMAADQVGRRKVLFLSSALVIFFGICVSLSTGYSSFTFFRMCVGFSSAGVFLSTYSLGLEVVGKSVRKMAGLFGYVIFALGYPVLAVLAYYLGDWRRLVLLVSVSYVAFFALYRVIPESPRWLLVHGDTEGARRVLEYIAMGNGTVMPSGDLKTGGGSSLQGPSMSDLFTRRIMAKLTLKLVVIWFSAGLAYYVLTMSSGELKGNVYYNFSLSGLVELPSLLLGYKLLSCIGRTWTTAGFFLLGGIVGILYSVLYWLGSESLSVAAAFTGKFSVSAAFNILYLFTAELYPTQVRNIGLGVCSISARVGGIMAPLVLLMDHLDKGIPMLVVGGICLMSGFIGLTLPETRDRPIVETISDLENQSIIAK